MKLSTESKIDFDRSISTEDRFGLRRWFEKLVQTLNQSNPQIWAELLGGDVSIVGFTDIPMSGAEFARYLHTHFEDGEYVLRYPELRASFQDGVYRLSGTFESFTDGILFCSGDITVEVVKDEDEKFRLKSQQLSPRFRVQK